MRISNIHRYDLKQPAPTGAGIDRDTNILHAAVTTLTSTGGCDVPRELTKVRDALARAFSADEVNQLGRETGQACACGASRRIACF